MILRSALLYAALLLGANIAHADMADIAALRDGDMKKLMFHEAAKPAGTASFETPEGEVHTLEDYRGKVVLLNFWATWCAPCREEMPYLDALQAEFGGDDFEVVPVATGRNRVAGVKKFFGEVGVENLPILLDPKQALAREMGVMAMPVTVLLDREGNEIARLMGDAHWASDSAKAIVSALIADGGGS